MSPSTNSSLNSRTWRGRGWTRRASEEENAAKTHRQFHPRLAIFDRRRAGGKYVQRAIEEHRMQCIFIRARQRSHRTSATRPADCPPPAAKFADRAELLAVTQAQIAHVPVKAIDFDWLQFRERRSHFEEAKADSVRSPRSEPTTWSDHATLCSKRLWIAKVRSLGE